MENRNVIIWGAGGHALVVADAVRAAGNAVVGFVDTVSPERNGIIFDGAPVMGSTEEVVAAVRRFSANVAFGFGDCMARLSLFQKLSELNVPFETVIHPCAQVSRAAEVAEGVYIGPYAVVESRCVVGAGTIVNCGACVCHEVSLGRAVTVCPGVMIGGKSIVGDKTWLGISSSVIDKITIGNGCFIGAGAVVVSDFPDNVLATGVPARVVKHLNSGV